MITLAATPIGNSDDASLRLRDLLRTADLIAAEDTRKLRGLLSRMNVTTEAKIIAYHEHNEASRTADLIAAAHDGLSVVVVSDAGMPGISDPGFRVVTAAIAAGVAVTVAPGPSAVLAALALSGLPTDRFCFEGFLPRKAAARARMLGELGEEKRTIVFYEAPHRLAQSLEAMSETFGNDRAAAVCRELTKTYEEVRRGPLAELVEWAGQGVRGEIVVVVAGAPEETFEEGDLVARVLQRIDAGERTREAVDAVAAETATRKRGLYEAVLAAREAREAPTSWDVESAAGGFDQDVTP